MAVDNESPPGAWEKELSRLPWGYGQEKPQTVEDVIVRLRRAGFDHEANILMREFAILKARR